MNLMELKLIKFCFSILGSEKFNTGEQKVSESDEIPQQKDRKQNRPLANAGRFNWIRSHFKIWVDSALINTHLILTTAFYAKNIEICLLHHKCRDLSM